jgi:hypothetical protein
MRPLWAGISSPLFFPFSCLLSTPSELITHSGTNSHIALMCRKETIQTIEQSRHSWLGVPVRRHHNAMEAN